MLVVEDVVVICKIFFIDSFGLVRINELQNYVIHNSNICCINESNKYVVNINAVVPVFS